MLKEEKKKQRPSSPLRAVVGLMIAFIVGAIALIVLVANVCFKGPLH